MNPAKKPVTQPPTTAPQLCKTYVPKWETDCQLLPLFVHTEYFLVLHLILCLVIILTLLL